MTITGSVRVSWPEWAGILAVCTISGTVVGAAAYWARRPPGMPLPYLLPVTLGAVVVAFFFAVIASVLASIFIILVARYGDRHASRLRLAATGAVSGAVLGALHPFVLLLLVVRALSPESGSANMLSLGAVVAASGAVAGALIVPKYVPRVRARSVRSRAPG